MKSEEFEYLFNLEKERQKILRKEFYISSLRKKEDIQSSIDECQQKVDVLSRIEGYDTIILYVNKEGFVVDENGNYFVKEFFFHLERMEKKVCHLFISEQMFEYKQTNYRNKCVRYRSRYRVS